MDDFAMQFGIFMGQLVAEYRTMFKWLAPIPHLATLLLFFYIGRYGQRSRKFFSGYFLVNFVWLLIFVGGWFSIRLFVQIGPAGLAMYGATPVLLTLILIQWVKEFQNPRSELDLSGVSIWRWLLTIPFIIWGFWYPPYEWGVGLDFHPRELLLGAYGLMGCPSIMVPLGILFLKYPRGNQSLFHLLTIYAICIGFAMVMLKYLPDIPFFLQGLVSLGLIIKTRASIKTENP